MLTWTYGMFIMSALYLLGIFTGVLWFRYRLAKLERKNIELNNERLEKVKILMQRSAAPYRKPRKRRKFKPSPIYNNQLVRAEIENLLKDIDCE